MTLLPALAMVTRHVGSGDHGVHHLQRAVQPGPQVRHAGPDQQRPRRLERRRVMVGRTRRRTSGWKPRWTTTRATRVPPSSSRSSRDYGIAGKTALLLFDKASGRYFDEAKMHVLNHQGRFFKVRGPLNVAGMPQGHPVIVQAGASEQGRELGAATADVIYAIHGSRDSARSYYTDVKGRMAKYGRAAGRSENYAGVLSGRGPHARGSAGEI